MHEEHGWSLIMVFNANIAYMGMKEAMLGNLGNSLHHIRKKPTELGKWMDKNNSKSHYF